MKKRTISFQKIFNIALSAVMLAGTYSCSNGSTTENTSKEVTENTNDKKFDDQSSQEDAQFIMAAAEINLEEIKLGQLAQQNSTTTGVKEMGKMMEDQHTQSYNELTVLAQNKIVTIPTEMNKDGSAFYENMKNKKGAEFDKEYTSMMIDGHKRAIALFETAANSRDADVKQYATKTLPALQAHLNAAIANNK